MPRARSQSSLQEDGDWPTRRLLAAQVLRLARPGSGGLGDRGPPGSPGPCRRAPADGARGQAGGPRYVGPTVGAHAHPQARGASRRATGGGRGRCGRTDRSAAVEAPRTTRSEKPQGRLGRRPAVGASGRASPRREFATASERSAALARPAALATAARPARPGRSGASESARFARRLRAKRRRVTGSPPGAVAVRRTRSASERPRPAVQGPTWPGGTW